MSNLEPREELASIAASLRAYLEQQVDCGSSGIPRRPREPRGAAAAEPPAPSHVALLAGEPPATARAVVGAPDRTDDPRTSTASNPSAETSTLAASIDEPPTTTAQPTTAQPTTAQPTTAQPTTSDRSGVAEATSATTMAPITLSSDDYLSPLAPKAPPPSPPPVREPRALEVIAAEVAGCTKCVLHTTRTQTVFERGSPTAKLCFIGEAPGADEDAQGIPFVGRAGQLLDKMIVAMGLDPVKDVYVCNIVKCRPPGNRKPEPEETASCIPYLHEQLARINPNVIVALGNTSVASLLGTKVGISKIRGSWKLYRGKIPVMPTYHPSYLLRPSAQQAEAKRQVWEDLQTVMRELGLRSPPRA